MLRFFLLFLISIYKVALSPLLPRCCRYPVSCSQYMYSCITAFGVFLGIYFGIIRLLSCSRLSKKINLHLER